MAHHRLRHLRSTTVLGHEVPIAAGFRPRLLGLAYLDREAAGPGLLIPRCSSVHTFGMRFALDLVFLDRHGRPCSARRAVPPRRFASERAAAAVLELPCGASDLEIERIGGYPSAIEDSGGGRVFAARDL